ncbi:MAG: hypothetical protein WCO35_01360 [Candidatus Nomurabacteria bacterium]
MLIENKMHLNDVCNEKDNKCRFLTLTAIGFQCEKYSHLMSYINRDVKNGILKDKGDNCNLPLDIILEMKDKLKDKEILIFNHEISRSRGTVKDIFINKTNFIIKTSYKNEPLEIFFNLQDLEIAISEEEISLISGSIISKIYLLHTK